MVQYVLVQCIVQSMYLYSAVHGWSGIMELSGVIFATGVTDSMNIDRRTNMKPPEPIGFARF